MTRRGRMMAATLLSAGLLAGCSDAEQEYCTVLEDKGSVLTELASQSTTPGTDVLTPSLAAIEDLREAAPDDLRDEWTTVLNAWQGLADAVAAAGVPPGEYRPGVMPDGVTGADRRRLEGAATKLAGLPVLEAAGAIEDHARQVCDVDLGG